MGGADNAFPAGSVTMVDSIHALHVTLLSAYMELAGADEAALGLGRNLCLVGQELVQFSHVAQTGEASFRLEGLRRGLLGTEWAMASHEEGEAFLLLEEDRLVELAPYGSGAEIGGGLPVYAVGVGDSATAEIGRAAGGDRGSRA